MSEAKITLSAEDKTRAAFAGVKRNLLDLKDTGNRLNASFGGLGVVLGSAFAGLSLTSFLRSTLEGIDRLNDIKDASGSSIESISALEDIAARTGTTIDTVSASLIKFNGVLSDSRAGSESAAVFKALGLSVDELKRLDPAEALRRTAVALSGFADDGNKARIVQQLFGRSVREVAPFLNDLAEAGQLNATVTAKQAAEAEKFNKQLAQLGKSSTDLARQLSSGLVGVLVELTDRLTVARQVFGGFSGILSAGLKGQAFADAAEGLREYNKQIADVDASIRRISEKPRTGGFGPLLDKEAIGDLQKQRAELSKFAEFYRTLVNAGSAGQGRGNGLPKPALPAVVDSAKAGKTRGDGAGAVERRSTELDYQQEITQSVGKLLEDADVVRVAKLNDQLVRLNELRKLGLDSGIASDAEAKIYAQLGRNVDSSAEAFRRLELQATAATVEAFKTQELDAYADKQKRLADLLGNTVSAEIERQRDDMLLLADAFDQGRISADQFTEAATARLNLAAKSTDSVKSAAEELGLSFSSALEDVIVAGGDLGDVLRGLEADIIRIITRKLITEPLAGGITGLLGGATGFLGSLFGAGKAYGGPVEAGTLYPINETGRGPGEIFSAGGRQYLLPTQGGNVTPNGSGRGGGMTVVNQFTLAGGAVDQRTQQQIAAAAGRGVQRALARNG